VETRVTGTPRGLDAAYAAAFDGLPVPLLVYDPETGRILAANDAACEQYGYDRDELLSLGIEDLIDPADVPRHREVVRRDGPRAGVWRDRRKDGTRIWVEAASTEIPFEGRPARLVVAVDVTERERALEELRASESRLRALVGSIDEVLFEFDRDGTCLGIWTVNEALLVAPRERMLGRRVVELVGDRWGVPLQEAIARVIDTGRAETVEYDVDLPDGTHWALARIAPIPGPDGRPHTASFLARDITSRVRAEQELRRTDERLRTLIEQLPAVVIVERPSPDPRKILIEYLSPRAEGMYGYPLEEIVNDSSFFERALHPEDRERVLAANARSEQTGEPFDQVYRVIRGDGRVMWVHSTSRLIRDAEGYPQEWVGVELDITAQKEAEQALREVEERAEEERRALLARLVSAQEEERARIAADIHDDPVQAMVAVGMQLDLLAEECADARALERVHRLQESVHRAVTRLRTLLFELAAPSLESGLAAAVMELAARDHWGFEIAVEDRARAELPMQVRTAAFRIVQEALANVRKHAAARHAWVRIEDRDGGVRVLVEDDGVGITPEQLQPAPGHLGLQSMRQRASLCSGRVEVGPRVEGGTRVEIWLPARA
jgi:PAS domain S-box-containing protein